MFQSGLGVFEELADVQAGIEDLWERNRLLQAIGDYSVGHPGFGSDLLRAGHWR